MAEDMLEEVEVITVTGDDGQEEYYSVDVTIPYAGKEFAVLVPYSEEEDSPAEGDAIIARLDEEDGETVYVAPTDEEFKAVLHAYDKLVEDEP